MFEINMVNILIIVTIGVATLMITSILKSLFLIMRDILTVIGGITIIIVIATIVYNLM